MTETARTGTASGFLRNAWYMAAWDYELGDNLLSRTICCEPVVLFRGHDGTPVALEDACAHRKAPLSMGRLDGGIVECPYHGLRFDGTGSCVHVPGQRRIPPGARVPAYRTAEKWRGIWIWLGDPSRADEALIPDFHWNNDPDWALMRDVMPMKAHYRLLVENLLDLTHLGYLHRDSIGNPETAEQGQAETRRTGDRVVLERVTADCVTPPFYRQLRGLPELTDRRNRIEFFPPCSVVIESSAAPAGGGLLEGDYRDARSHMVLNAITPETETTLIYFWSNLRNYRLGDEALSGAYHDGLVRVFGEDQTMVEAQQRYFARHPDTLTADFNIDSGVMEARRIMDRLLAAERAAV